MINVENLARTYTGKIPTLALRGISFEVQDGEFVCHNGAAAVQGNQPFYTNSV